MADPADYYREIYAPRPRRRDAGAPGRRSPSWSARAARGDGRRGPPTTSSPAPAREDTMRRQPRGLPRAGGSCRGCCATSPSATSRPTRARHGDAGAAAAGADRRAEDRPRRRRAGDRPRRGGARPADDRQHRLRTSRWRRSPRPAATAPRWFQLYWPNDRRARRELRRPRRGGRLRRDRRSPSTPSSPAGSRATCSRPGCRSSKGIGIANYFQDPVFRAGLEKPPEEDVGAATGHFLGVHANPSLTWDDLGLAARA